MFEVFHFITPLEFESFQSHNAISKILNTLDTRISYTMIPLLNINTLDKSTSNESNNLAQLNYIVSLDFEAMAGQGKKIARLFLNILQTELLINNQTYSKELINKIINQIGADIEMFYEDRNSLSIKQYLTKNQQLANKFCIKNNPSVVIFDNGLNDYGLLIENFSENNLNFIINEYLTETAHEESLTTILPDL